MTSTNVDLPEFCSPTSVSSISSFQKRLLIQSVKVTHTHTKKKGGGTVGNTPLCVPLHKRANKTTNKRAKLTNEPVNPLKHGAVVVDTEVGGEGN